MSDHKKISREKVAAHRQRLRARGLRPIQIWVPDTRTAAFKEAARREALELARGDTIDDTQDFLESIFDEDGF